ncbi:hypothetical protein GGTG_10863 [Gaeumannomyces tritici R3-111a-1]|uniref:Clr5 domain-containing protein n=1 Tax=Gaeumannomyces tritici (strain R3-111a-1) TaxID=644352 RepID=J3PBJ1_GAET3|nr:hypothetical protein GGTG_10863 [Gaeumannomyces tritici R3-111a-1]EJT71608.1 hypothetical protein GGTG_10863 [Gaeumannomyces tritici R3-111a-1]
MLSPSSSSVSSAVAQAGPSEACAADFPAPAVHPPPPQDQWNSMRPIITRLYKDQNRTLKETIEIMERDHQFYATPRMYKTRIKNWGLDKKFKAQEVLVMLQAKKERETENKDTEFVVRGTKVDPRRMRRYLQRNKTVLDRFNDASLDTAQLPPPHCSRSGDDCSPSASPTSPQAQGRRGRTPTTSTAVQVRTPSPEPHPTPTLGLPGPTRDTERLLFGVRAYMGGSFAAGTWFWDGSGRVQSRKGARGEALILDAWTRLEVVASGMATAEQVNVFDTLNPAFEAIREIVREEAPLLVSRMLRLSRKLALLGNRQLWAMLVDFIGAQTQRLLGSHHILLAIWQQFRDVDMGTDEEVLDRAFMLIVAEFERTSCGSPINFGVMETNRDHYDTVSSLSRRRSLEAQEASLRQTLALTPHAVYGTLPALGLRHRMRITSSLLLCEKEEFERAEALMLGSPFSEYDALGKWAIASQHGVLGHLYAHRGELDRSETEFLAAVALVEGVAGYGNESCCERMMANLERLYTFAQRPADAASMRDRRLQRLLSNTPQQSPQPDPVVDARYGHPGVVHDGLEQRQSAPEPTVKLECYETP